MRQRTCIALCSVHLLTLAICTYIAAIKIESILVTGWICSFTGIISTLVMLVQLNLLVAPAGKPAREITLMTIMVSMTSFSVFFAIARQLLNREHNWLMALALGLIGLTFVGLTIVMFTAISQHYSRQDQAGSSSPTGETPV